MALLTGASVNRGYVKSAPHTIGPWSNRVACDWRAAELAKVAILALAGSPIMPAALPI